MLRTRFRLSFFWFITGIILVACADGPEQPLPTAASAQAVIVIDEAAIAAEGTNAAVAGNGNRVPVRWFVGLGTRSGTTTFAGHQQVVAAFNAAQDSIELILEVADGATAVEMLNRQIMSGNAPDIVGPMSLTSQATFPDAWLDLGPLIMAANYDLSDFDPALIDFYRTAAAGQVTLPFVVYPSFLFVNMDLFAAAGMPAPPQQYGMPYVDENGVAHEWNMATLRDVAMKLTVDGNGHSAAHPQFDAQNIVQFGYGEQWTDLRGRLTLFGPGTLVDGGGNAVIPPQWQNGVRWYHDAMWNDFFHPHGAYNDSPGLGDGNWFASGNLAIVHSHLWYATCCLGDLAARWDTAVVPAANGQTTVRLHADGFTISKGVSHPEEAFTALTYLLGTAAGDLAQAYDGLPARRSLQSAYFERLSANQFAGQNINWNVITTGIAFPDKPNHEARLPNDFDARARLNAFDQLLGNSPELDLDVALAVLQEDLQVIFDAANR